VRTCPSTWSQHHLASLREREWAQLREARMLWQLTPAGREEHRRALDEDVAAIGVGAMDDLKRSTRSSSRSTSSSSPLRRLAAARRAPERPQRRAYDAPSIERLVSLDGRARPVVQRWASSCSARAVLAASGSDVPAVLAGERNMFTGVMCGSYHDVWMELHEDLILTQASTALRGLVLMARFGRVLTRW
jgi:hypothetical protein